MISSKQHSMNGTRTNLLEWAEVCDFEKHVVQHTMGLEIYSLYRLVRQDSYLSCSVYATCLFWRRILRSKEEACSDSLNKTVHEFEGKSKIRWVFSGKIFTAWTLSCWDFASYERLTEHCPKFFYRKLISAKVAYSILSFMSVCGSLKICKLNERLKCLFAQNKRYFSSVSSVNKVRREQLSSQGKKKTHLMQYFSLELCKQGLKYMIHVPHSSTTAHAMLTHFCNTK